MGRQGRTTARRKVSSAPLRLKAKYAFRIPRLKPFNRIVANLNGIILTF